MTPEVKERIEQIRYGNVPEGYKKTEVGVVPSDWNAYKLGELLDFKNGINADKEKFGHGTKLISVRDILSDSPIVYNSIQGAVDIDMHQIEEFSVEYGDVLFQRSSENYEDVGTSNVYLDPQNTAVFSGFVIRGKKKAKYNPVYFNSLLRCFYVRKQIMRQAAGAQHINVGQESLAKVSVVLANDFEQEKIADILMKLDKVVELKEKLLAEKQRQKKYLMQQLLTGKKRLPGFDGEWMYVRANQIFKNVTDKKHDGTLEVLSATQDRGIIPRSQVDIDIKYAEESLTGYKKVVKGNFVISLRSFQGGIEYSEYTGIVSPAYTVLTSIYPIEDNYYKQFFKSTDYINRLNIAVYGIRDGKQISYDDFGRIKIPYPPLEEQKAIAAVLTTADQEIEILKKSIEQEKQKKKSLMQLLLTGIVRVTAE